MAEKNGVHNTQPRTRTIKCGLRSDSSPVTWRVFRILLSQAWRSRVTDFSSSLEMVFSGRRAATVAVVLLRCGDVMTVALLCLTVATVGAVLKLPPPLSWLFPYVDLVAAAVVAVDLIGLLFKSRKQRKFFRCYGVYSKRLGLLLPVAMHWRVIAMTAVVGVMMMKLSRYGVILGVVAALGIIALLCGLSYPIIAVTLAFAGGVLGCAVLTDAAIVVGTGFPGITIAAAVPYLMIPAATCVFAASSCTLAARYTNRYRLGAMRERSLRIKLVCITAGILLTAWFPAVAVKDFPNAAEYQVPGIIIGYFLYCMMTRILLLKYTSPEALGYLIFYFKARQFSAQRIWGHYNVNFLMLSLPVGLGLVSACFFTPLIYSSGVLLLSCMAAELFLDSAIVMRFFKLYRKADLLRLRQTSRSCIAAFVLLLVTSPLITLTTPVVSILVGEQPLRLEPETVWASAACLAMVGLAVAAINVINGKNWLENLWEPVKAEHV